MSEEKKPTFSLPVEPQNTPLNGYLEMSLEYHRRVEERKLKSQNKQWGWSIVSDEYEDEDSNSAPDWWD
jgi:hypothetical protein